MLNKKVQTIIAITIILILAIVTRFYMLGKAPAGIYLDEAGQGYSAYSILKTGKDEFGKSFPIVFRSFTDFKTPVYIYLVVPLIPIFGLTAFTVRFPSFFFSILTFPVFYLLVRKLCPAKNSLSLSLISCLLLALSPWHILFGRTNFECNVALFFFLSGVLSFYAAIKNKPKFLLLSALMFAIAIPAYHSQRIITPLTLLILFIRYRTTLLSKAYKTYLTFGLIIGLIISVPTISVALTPGFLARANGLNIFSHMRQMPNGYLANYKGILSPIVNSSWYLSTKEFLSLYLTYLSPRSMFILGDSGPRSSFPDLSTFFLWQFPFYIYGLYLLIKNKELGELRFFTIVILLISPIPAAVTRDPYSTIRSLPLVIPQITIIAIGILSFFRSIRSIRIIRNFNLNLLLLPLLLLITVYSLAKLFSSVIILNEYYRANEWNYGWEQVASVLKNRNQKLPAVIDNGRNEGYIQLLFFLKFDPAAYQKDNYEVNDSNYYTKMDRDSTKKIGDITTRPIDWEKDLKTEQYLVGDELAISTGQIQSHNLTLIKEIYYPNKTVAFRVVKTNQ
jgi:4-amino-4-deoxy-L-arabinose transferase-like glycosyltransferase